MYIRPDLLWGVGSCNYRGWDGARAVSVRWRPRKAVWRPEKHGRWWCKYHSKGRRRPMSQLCSQAERTEPSFLHLLFSADLDPQLIGWCPPHWRGPSMEPTGQFKCQSHLKRPSRCTQTCLIWAPCGPVKSTHNITLDYNDKHIKKSALQINFWALCLIIFCF